MGDLLHKTLMSYHNDDPWDADEEHPDGLLWLLTPEELEDLPKGTVVECINGTELVKGRDQLDDSQPTYGLRGYRD